MQLDAIDQLAALNRVAAVYHQRTGQTATSWRDVIAAGYLRQVPQDPTGMPYQINPSTGEVLLASDSQLLPLPKTERVP
jgi:hypothetical protein